MFEPRGRIKIISNAIVYKRRKVMNVALKKPNWLMSIVLLFEISLIIAFVVFVPKEVFNYGKVICASVLLVILFFINIDVSVRVQNGYEKFRVQMRNCIKQNNEIDLPSGKYILNEEHGVIFFNESCIEEENICKFWNWVKDVGIVMLKDIPVEFNSISDVMLSIMHKLNYISKVIVSEDGINFSKKPNAYQYIMGLEE